MGAVEQVRELHEQVPRAPSPQTMLQTVGSSGRALVGSGIVSASVVASAAVSSEDVGVQPARLDGDPTLWEVRDVAEWLRLYAQLSVAQVRSAIEEHGVACGLDLLALDDGDLHALGLTRVAERKQLLRMLAALRLRARRAVSEARSRVYCVAQQHRLAALSECVHEVFVHSCDTLNLKTQRLLVALWSQCEGLGEDALARVERDATAWRVREQVIASDGV